MARGPFKMKGFSGFGEGTGRKKAGAPHRYKIDYEKDDTLTRQVKIGHNKDHDEGKVKIENKAFSPHTSDAYKKRVKEEGSWESEASIKARKRREAANKKSPTKHKNPKGLEHKHMADENLEGKKLDIAVYDDGTERVIPGKKKASPNKIYSKPKGKRTKY